MLIVVPSLAKRICRNFFESHFHDSVKHYTVFDIQELLVMHIH